MSIGDDLLDKIANMVADRVIERLGTNVAVTYTTAKTGPFCPGKSRAWMLRNLPLIPGAHKAGATWTIAARDYDQWVVANDVRKLKRAPVIGSDEALADQFLEASGYRSTKGAA